MTTASQESRAARAQAELSLLVDMVPSHLWQLAPDGEPTFFNKRMIDFLGLDVADMDKPGMTRLEALLETIHPNDAAQFSSALTHCLATGESFAMRYDDPTRRGIASIRCITSPNHVSLTSWTVAP